MWSPWATGVYTAEVSTTPPNPTAGLEEGSALSSQPPCSLGRPPSQPGTQGSPPNHLHFKENTLHLFPIHLHFSSP